MNKKEKIPTVVKQKLTDLLKEIDIIDQKNVHQEDNNKEFSFSESCSHIENKINLKVELFKL